MAILCEFKEYGSATGKSMKEYCQKEPYEGMDKIVSYLRNKGICIMTRPKPTTDRFTGELVKGEYGIVLYTDGRYEWYSDLAYHVEKYNLRLLKEFEDYVLSLE